MAKTKLQKRLENDEYEITIKDTLYQGRKIALNKKGERTFSKEENQLLNDYLDRYEALIFKIDEIEDEYEGLDRAWRIGKVLVERKKEAEQSGEDFSFMELIPAISIESFSSSTAYQYRNLYKMFPDKGYDQSISLSSTHELMQRSDSREEARSAYDNLLQNNESATLGEVRAWSNVDSEALSEIVAKTADAVGTLDSSSVRTVCILQNVTPLPTDEEIETAISQHNSS